MDKLAAREIQIPLVSIAAIKIAIFLWYHERVNDVMNLNRNKVDQVMGNVEPLQLPKKLQRKVLNYIQSVGYYLQKTFTSLYCMMVPHKYCETRWPSELNLPKLLCWRNIGTLDKGRTAKKIIDCVILDTISTFRLACFNCIESEILKLWCNSRSRVDRYLKYLMIHESMEVAFWLSYLKGKIRMLMRIDEDRETDELTVFEFGFICGIRQQNIEFLKYFGRKLENSKRNQLMLSSAKGLLELEFRNFPSDIFLLVFSHLDTTQKVQIFAEDPLYRLPHLLSWPLQDFFLDISKELYDDLSEPHFLILLNFLYLNVWRYKFSYEILERIFNEFWESSSDRHKTYVLREWIFGRLYVAVFQSNSYEARLGESDIEDRFIGLMFANGLMVLEVLTGYCYLNSLENAVSKYMSKETLGFEFQRTISELRSDHACESLCHPNRFDEEIADLEPNAARLVYYEL